MAIYVGLKSIEEDENLKVYKFFRSDGSLYGHLSIDKETGEIELIDSVDQRGEGFAFPRARKALKDRWENGELPDLQPHQKEGVEFIYKNCFSDLSFYDQGNESMIG